LIKLDEVRTNWCLTTLKEISLNIQYGYTASTNENSTGVKYLRITDIQNNSVDWNTVPLCKCEQIDIYKLKKGDIVIARTGATTGKSFLLKNIPETSVFASYLIRLETIDILCLPEYIAIYMQSRYYWKQITVVSKGTAQPGANASILSKLKIPLPPLNEQKRIVTKIEALQTKSTAAKQQLQQIKPLLDRFRQSVLAAAFRGDLTKTWREQNPDVESAEVLLERIKIERRRRWEEAELEKMKTQGKVPKDDNWKKKYKEPEAIDTEGLSELPDGWCWVAIEQFADVGTGATPLRKNTKYYDGGKVPWVTSGALNEIFIETAEEYITSLAIEETNAKVFPKHTLLVAMYGEGKTRGKISELLIEASTNQACAALILNGLASKIRPIVKLFFLKNYSDIRQIASGGVQPNLNLSMIKSTLVPLPPMNEQIEICSIVEHCMLTADNIKQQHQQAETQLETLNQSILAKAFRGELVPQDPNDEPASVLLERIKAEKTKQETTGKKTKKKDSEEPKIQQLNLDL
jgi:type I restriction enzyme, S subunit